MIRWLRKRITQSLGEQSGERGSEEATDAGGPTVDGCAGVPLARCAWRHRDWPPLAAVGDPFHLTGQWVKVRAGGGTPADWVIILAGGQVK